MKRRDFIRTAAIAVPAIATTDVVAAPKRKVTDPQKPKEEKQEAPVQDFRFHTHHRLLQNWKYTKVLCPT